MAEGKNRLSVEDLEAWVSYFELLNEIYLDLKAGGVDILAEPPQDR